MKRLELAHLSLEECYDLAFSAGATHEREECAKVCDRYAGAMQGSKSLISVAAHYFKSGVRSAALRSAEAIRKKGVKQMPLQITDQEIK